MTANKHHVNLVRVSSGALCQDTQGFSTDTFNILEIEREVVPIIFVPGIMGSRLINSEGKKIWDPDNKGFMLWNFGVLWAATAKKRKELLVGSEFSDSHAAVDSDEARDNAALAEENDTTRGKRGWGGVSWSSYGAILKALQTNQWDSQVNLFYEFPVHAFGYNWTASNNSAGGLLSKYISETIDLYKNNKDQPRKCEKVILVTHSMGGLVARAACMLHGAKERVAGVVHGVQPAFGSPAAYWRMKGGFERPHTIPEIESIQWLKNPLKMYAHQKEKIINSSLLGIPFTNIKFGKGNLMAWVLGTDGEEVTSLLGNMPGGLQLLPNKMYKNNDGHNSWLAVYSTDGERTLLPRSDPYEEIYRKKDVYYRLVRPEWLEPGTGIKSKLHEDVTPWRKYLGYLQQAESFHDALKDQVHDETYQFYSSGIASADRVVFNRCDHSLWENVKRFCSSIKDRMPDDLKRAGKSFVFTTATGGGPGIVPQLIDAAAEMVVDSTVGAAVRNTDWYANRGGYRDHVDESDKPSSDGDLNLVMMQLPDGAGDGTVPESSGRALKLEGPTKRTFCIADKSGFESNFVEKKAKRTKPKMAPDFDEGWFDRAHEPIYKTQSAQFITFTAIENICRKEIRKMLGKK